MSEKLSRKYDYFITNIHILLQYVHLQMKCEIQMKYEIINDN